MPKKRSQYEIYLIQITNSSSVWCSYLSHKCKTVPYLKILSYFFILFSDTYLQKIPAKFSDWVESLVDLHTQGLYILEKMSTRDTQFHIVRPTLQHIHTKNRIYKIFFCNATNLMYVSELHKVYLHLSQKQHWRLSYQ